MAKTTIPEVLHLKSENMSFPANIQRHAGGYASNLRLVTPEISKTFAAGMAAYEDCAFELTSKYDEAIIVLSGILRIRTGENYSRIMDVKAGDVIWIVPGIPMKWEFDKLTKIFYTAYPVDWRTRSEAAAVVETAAKHFHSQSADVELATTCKVENWFPYEMKMFLDLVFAESAKRKLRVKSVQMPPNWFSATIAAENSVREGAYNGVPVAAAELASDQVGIVFQRT